MVFKGGLDLKREEEGEEEVREEEMVWMEAAGSTFFFFLFFSLLIVETKESRGESPSRCFQVWLPDLDTRNWY